nr:MAG TPA: hypothetical protein [Caudoviricetes sp.]
MHRSNIVIFIYNHPSLSFSWVLVYITGIIA